MRYRNKKVIAVSSITFIYAISQPFSSLAQAQEKDWTKRWAIETKGGWG